MQRRLLLVELPHLAEGSPAKIAVACAPKVSLGKCLEAARGVKSRSRLMGNRFVLDEAVLTCRSNGLLIQMHSVEIAALAATDLGDDYRRVVPEILGTIRRPGRELLVVGGKCLPILGPLLGRCRVVLCCPRERVIEKVFSRLKNSRPTDCLR